MSVITNNLLLGDEGYFLTKSLRFRSSASAYLNRTPASAGNRKTFTWSGWLKLAVSSNDLGIISSYSDNNNRSDLRFGNGNSSISFYNIVGGSITTNLTTTQVFRDPSAWYHVVLSVDTTQATSSNRVKLYVNGTQVTAFSTATYPAQNNDFFFNSNVAQYIGATGYSPVSNYFDGYMTEVYLIDGQALTPSSFGETSTSTGVWIPKKYTGTYGTNGFYLPFTDVATTSGSNAGLGKDFSGNGNYWTTNNISVTSGSTYDSMKDVPTLTDADTANYWTLNPLNTGQLGTVQSGNLEWIGGDQNNFRTVAAQILPTTGKFYWEVTPIGGGSGGAFVSGIYIGIMNYANGGTGLFASGVRIADTGRDDYVYYSDGRKVNSNSFVSYGNSYAANDVIGIAVDIDNGKIWYSKNGTWQASGDPAAGTNAAYTTVPFSTKTYAPAMSAAEITNAQKFNFGQRPFAYTPPTGFKALNTFNLPTPTIGATASSQANKYFDALLYTGNGSASQRTDISWANMQPDMVWIKNRTSANNHVLHDDVRGTAYALQSNLTNATDGPVGFGTDGFGFDGVGNQLRIFTSDGRYNTNGNAYVTWGWKGSGAAGVTNTAGSITSTVSANTTAGFSIVTYTGNSTAGATVGHGLGVAPNMIIIKSRSNAYNWVVGAKAVDGFSSGKQLYLNTTSALVSTENFFNNTQPTSTVFTVKDNYEVNFSGYTYVAYCFAQVAGYSAFGSYTGNGNANGAFIFTGFRPRYVMVKKTSAADDWVVFDTARDTSNVVNNWLFPNLSNAELTTAGSPDILSNGFKFRSTSGATNQSGATFIYMAFAESPFKFSNAR